MQSPRRRMDRVLYLLVKKTREAHCWQMPQGVVGEGESLLEVHTYIYYNIMCCVVNLCCCCPAGMPEGTG